MAPAATAGDAGVVHFNWSDNSGIGKARGTDKAILVAWCQELNQTVYIISPARSAESADLPVPAFSGKSVQTWISFTTEKGNEIASSIFTGEVAVLWGGDSFDKPSLRRPSPALEAAFLPVEATGRAKNRLPDAV